MPDALLPDPVHSPLFFVNIYLTEVYEHKWNSPGKIYFLIKPLASFTISNYPNKEIPNSLFAN